VNCGLGRQVANKGAQLAFVKNSAFEAHRFFHCETVNTISQYLTLYSSNGMISSAFLVLLCRNFRGIMQRIEIKNSFIHSAYSTPEKGN
jgi:hypothetical protein